MTESTDPRRWGRRLSDAIRLALEAGDRAQARRLALEGDGQAQSLAREYALMYRGLGVTIRILLPLLAAIARRAGAAAEVEDLLRAFRADLLALMERAYGEDGAQPARAVSGADEAERTARLLEAGEALFSREQARLAAEAVAAIEAGDAGRARALLDRKERQQYVPLHDRLVRFMAESFGWALRRGGPAELLWLHRETAAGQRQGFAKWDALPAAEFARQTTFLLKQHMGAAEVEEDAERFTIRQHPCGSGGRLRLGGAYDGEGALPFVEGPGPLTFGEARLPVYCSHCPIWNGMMPIEWFGRPHWVFETPARADGSCTLHVYKRRDGAPREYGARVGAQAGRR